MQSMPIDTQVWPDNLPPYFDDDGEVYRASVIARVSGIDEPVIYAEKVGTRGVQYVFDASSIVGGSNLYMTPEAARAAINGLEQRDVA